MMRYSAYVICATQRSGSTLLCDLLTASRVAGDPNSYFRAPDIGYWAAEWGVPGPASPDDPAFNRAYLDAMIRVGTAGTGIFGLRLMWDSTDEAARRLDAALGASGDLAARLVRAFGPILFIHLSRRAKLAQAVSFVRAQQTGLWHVAADGSERERLAPAQPETFDADRIAEARDRLAADDRHWAAFFDKHSIAALSISYEDLSADPQSVLADILTALGLDPGHTADARPVSRKMGDAVSAEWIKRMGTA